MKRYIHHIIALFIITILVGILTWTNHVPGTMLAGWDDLHHEFDFQLAFTRTIQGVWRADQGLGAVAGHSHMSDLPRIIILWITSLVVPLQNIRFVFVILSLFVGALGMYVFMYTLLINKIQSRSSEEQRDPSTNPALSKVEVVGMTNVSDNKIASECHPELVEGSLSSVSIVALVSTLVYVLNLGTIQQFILPFEMFMVQFALLPWLILSATWYLQKPRPRRLVIFAIIALLFSPTAYAATLWYVFFGIFITWLILTLLIQQTQSLRVIPLRVILSLSKDGQRSSLSNNALRLQIKHFLILVAVFITMNLYWILPNIYFAKYHGEEVRTSKINTIFSPDMFAANKQFGNVKDALLLKSFLFDWQMYDYDTHSFPQIMETWRTHLANPLALATGYLITFMGIGGILIAIKRKDTHVIPYAVFFVIPFLLLLNGTWPISALYEQLSTLSPLIKEALRTPFTKVSIPAGFGLALFVGYFVVQLHHVGKQIFRFRVMVVIASILYFALPAFNGGYIHRLVQVKIPSAYFEMFDYFKSQPKHARVALLPIHTFWNWTYYTWGYQGAGFLQFGIPQPLLDRDYGRWTEQNEQYNREMSYAWYSQNAEILALTINKFDIEYVVLDTSVFEPSLPTQHSLLNWISPTFIEETQLFEKPLRFGDHILVYKRLQPRDGDVYIAQGLPTVDSHITKNSPLDFTYMSQGAYLSSTSNISRNKGTVPNFVDPNSIRHKFRADFVHTDPRWGYCADRKNSESGRTLVGEGIRYISVDTNVCETFVFPDLPHDTSYILVMKSTNFAGRPLTFCVKNLLTGHCDLSEQLRYAANDTTEYYHLPRLWDYGQGYQVEVTNIARGRGKSENSLLNMEMWEVDDPIINNQSTPIIIPVDIQNENNYLRNIQIDMAKLSGKESVIVLDQAYEGGWMGLQVQSTEYKVPGIKMNLPKLVLLSHVRVNGWASGWKINSTEYRVQSTKSQEPSAKDQALPTTLKLRGASGTRNSEFGTSTILLLFWPQYLEYGGIAVLALTIGILAAKQVQKMKATT